MNLILFCIQLYRYRPKPQFLELYDSMNTDLTYDLFESQLEQAFTEDFTKLYTKARRTLHNDFREDYFHIASHLLMVAVPAILLPIIFLWPYWPYYIFFILTVTAYSFVYAILVANRTTIFYRHFIVVNLLVKYHQRQLEKATPSS